MRPSTLARVLGLLPALAWASNSTSSIVIPNTRDSFLNSTRGAGTFTGEAWIDIGHVDDETWIGHVTFTPSARSYWHRHERGSCSTSWPAPAGC
ncbi:hypothetical protein NM208_g15957 [Fusarium decemcellulare]|uniref:Uncharacterized protein n=1 Tax=Fusarium decemcellulare TaxID=57161 RepID=A0ACC1RBP1_9HYPO|nr:hypothetical protein NM208_g15957 [Fusarium decemcellulare]